MNTKIILTGASSVCKMDIARRMVDLDDELSIAETFTTDKEYQGKETEDYISFMNYEDVNLAFKNNVVMYITTNNYISHGITIDSFYNDDIFVMSMEDFNNISGSVFDNKDVLIVWVDSKKYDDKAQREKDVLECKYLSERLDKMPYLYFLDEDKKVIADVLLKYYYAEEEERKQICEENN